MILSGASPQQSEFNLSNLFAMSGIGDIASGLSLFSRALNGDEVGADEIPPGLQRQALHMAMTQVGVNPAGDNAIEEFLGKEEVIGQVREALHADLKENTETPQDTILFKAIDDMSGQELQTLLVGNPEVASMITESQGFQDMLQEKISDLTVYHALSSSGISMQAINESSNQEFLNTNLNELTVEDLQGLEPSQLDMLIPALPQDVFNAKFMDVINSKLGEDQQVQAPTEDTYAARQEAYQTAKDNLIEHGPGGLTGLFTSVISAFGDGPDLEARFYSSIQDSIDEGTITQFQTMAQEQTNEYVQNFNFTDMEPEAIRTFFDENKDMIAAQLVDQENWPKIEEAINADLLIRNQQRIMDAMLPEMTEEGLSMFQQALDKLPPEIRDLLTSFIDFAADILGKIGIDMDGFGSEPERTTNPDTTPDEYESFPDLTPERIEELERTTIATSSAPPVPGQ